MSSSSTSSSTIAGPVKPCPNYFYYTIFDIVCHIYMANIFYQSMVVSGTDKSDIKIMGWVGTISISGGIIDHIDKYYWNNGYQFIQQFHIKFWRHLFGPTVVYPTFIFTLYLTSKVTFINNNHSGSKQLMLWTAFISQGIFTGYVFGKMDKSTEKYGIMECIQHTTDILLYIALTNALKVS